jgi:hypothetical protein
MVWRKQEEARIKNEQKAAEQEMKDSNKPKDVQEPKPPTPPVAPQRGTFKQKPADMLTNPPPKMPPGTLPSQAPNVRLPDKVQQPIPDPQILEQLY